MSKDSVPLPNSEGIWLHEPTNKQIEIYRLEPAGGQLCFWGPDLGITYSGAQETQGIWDTDEWQGHIRVEFYDRIGPWKLVSREITAKSDV